MIGEKELMTSVENKKFNKIGLFKGDVSNAVNWYFDYALMRMEEGGAIEDVLSHLKNPVQTYEEFIGDYSEERQKMFADDVDPRDIKAYNELVRQFNMERERILRKQDLDALKRYQKKFNDLFGLSDNN